MDAMKLFMAIPDRINFLPLGRYGCLSEQTYRSLFEHETFDWFAFNSSIISKRLTDKIKAIAIDPSCIPKSDKKTPWIGYFWSGCAGDNKRGLEILGIGIIDIDNHDCMTLGSIQTPDCKTLDNLCRPILGLTSSLVLNWTNFPSIVIRAIIGILPFFFTLSRFRKNNTRNADFIPHCFKLQNYFY